MIIGDFGNINVYIALAINGIFTGLGAALGVHLANKGIIDSVNRLVKKIKGKNGDSSQDDKKIDIPVSQEEAKK